ncbi:MAG: MBL fold metallo-hydrolase [Paludibacteraceae bacterium]|nr:MBL fold metallo-hydrolase [Paludibacteraceae bacterium]
MTRLVSIPGIIPVNSYLHIDPETQTGFLIDPGADAPRLLHLIEQQHWTIEAILLTHGHFDHIGAVAEISERLGIPYYIHRNGEAYLADPSLNLSAYSGVPIVLHGAQYLDDGDIIRLKANPEWALQVIHTPGHTPDSVVYYHPSERTAFVGDTIFSHGSYGATHFPGGNAQQLFDSIRKRILTLPPDTRLLSGHSEPFQCSEWGSY